MIGTMEMAMIKEDKIWKIDNLNMLKFDKFALPQGEDAYPAKAGETVVITRQPQLTGSNSKNSGKRESASRFHSQNISAVELTITDP